jgi:hypothetical protein
MDSRNQIPKFHKPCRDRGKSGRRIKIDGDALVATKYQEPQRFEDMVQSYRQRGASDRQIIAAMVGSPKLIDAVGHRKR